MCTVSHRNRPEPLGTQVWASELDRDGPGTVLGMTEAQVSRLSLCQREEQLPQAVHFEQDTYEELLFVRSKEA